MASEEFLKPAKGLTRELSRRAKPIRGARRKLVALDDAVGGRVRNDLSPELQLRTLGIASLKMPARAIRKVDPAHVAEVARSICEFGNVSPPIVSGQYDIVDGVVVIEAAKSLGMTEIDCLIVCHLDPAQLKLLRLALNRLQERGEWDLGELKVVFGELIEADISLDVTGFSIEETDLILHQDVTVVDDAVNEVPSIGSGISAVSQLGDLWRLGRHKLLCGDATDSEGYDRLFAKGPKAKAAFTDPPYNICIDGFAVGAGAVRHREFIKGSGELTDSEFTDFLRTSLESATRHVSDGGAVFVCMDWRHSEHIQSAGRRAGLQHLNTIVWVKGHGGLGGVYRSAHEFVFLFKKGDAPILNNVALGKHGRDRSNVWTYPGAGQKGSSAHAQAAHHPTPKPVELVADALLDVTSRGDIVIDPFAGSGTTLIAAQSKGRICHAIDLDPLYVDLMIRRFQKYTETEAVLEESGKTFAEVGRERSGSPAQPSLSVV
jgi:DNA modification methylase